MSVTVNEACHHRIVFVDYENGVERCDTTQNSGKKGCGHVFKKFTPQKHVCKQPEGICNDACLEELR